MVLSWDITFSQGALDVIALNGDGSVDYNSFSLSTHLQDPSGLFAFFVPSGGGDFPLELHAPLQINICYMES